MRSIALVSLLLVFASTFTAQAEVMLQSYEPNTIGVTNDSDDVAFLDVKLSLKYPLMPDFFRKNVAESQFYFAATVRFAQYLRTRESSPVVGKRFNPKFVWRWTKPLISGLDHLEFAYAHESNGQSINNPEEFLAEVQRQKDDRGEPRFAKDFISRGWDYIEVAGRYRAGGSGFKGLTIYPSFRLFLDDGLLQGPAEEYNGWENDPEGKKRKEVQGLAVLFRQGLWEGKGKLALIVETGYAKPFRYNTLRLEARADFHELPLMVFYQNGYNSDLALYYKRVSTIGLGLELATFE